MPIHLLETGDVVSIVLFVTVVLVAILVRTVQRATAWPEEEGRSGRSDRTFREVAREGKRGSGGTRGRTCPSCGQVSPANFDTCYGCGARLAGGGTASGPSSPPSRSRSSETSPSRSADDAGGARRKKRVEQVRQEATGLLEDRADVGRAASRLQDVFEKDDERLDRSDPVSRAAAREAERLARRSPLERVENLELEQRAWVLHEIFGPPRSRTRGDRSG